MSGLLQCSSFSIVVQQEARDNDPLKKASLSYIHKTKLVKKSILAYKGKSYV